MVGAHRGWRVRIIARIGLGKEPARAREYRGRSQAKPVIVRDGRVVGVFASLRRRIVVVASRCKYVNSRVRESSCNWKLLASTFSRWTHPQGYPGIPLQMSLGRKFFVARRLSSANWCAKGTASDSGWKGARTGTVSVFAATFKGWDMRGAMQRVWTKGEIDALFSRRLRNRNGPSMTDRPEARALRVRGRRGPY